MLSFHSESSEDSSAQLVRPTSNFSHLVGSALLQRNPGFSIILKPGLVSGYLRKRLLKKQPFDSPESGSDQTLSSRVPSAHISRLTLQTSFKTSLPIKGNSKDLKCIFLKTFSLFFHPLKSIPKSRETVPCFSGLLWKIRPGNRSLEISKCPLLHPPTAVKVKKLLVTPSNEVDQSRKQAQESSNISTAATS